VCAGERDAYYFKDSPLRPALRTAGILPALLFVLPGARTRAPANMVSLVCDEI